MILLTLLAPAHASDTQAVVDGLLAKMVTASAAVRDATWLLRMEEWKDGRMLPAQDIEVKYRRNPETLYLKWVGKVHTDRELMWGRSFNDGDLLVNTSSLVPNLSLDPMGTLAMRDSRHPIWMAALPRIADLVAEGAEFLKGRPDLTAEYTDLGIMDVFGTQSHCYRAVLPYEANPGVMYAPEIQLCLSTATGLPSRFIAWADEDGARRQVEDYAFRQVKANVGLTEADFDPENEAYGF